METEVEFCGEDSGLVGLVFNLFLNIKKTTAATMTKAVVPPIITAKVLNDVDEGDDVDDEEGVGKPKA